MTSTKNAKLIAKAQQANSRKKYQDAIAYCKQVIKNDATNVSAYQLQSIALTQLSRYHEATPVIKKALSLSPEGSTDALRHLLGCNYIYTEQYHLSLPLLKALFNETGNPDILLDIGLNLAEQGAYQEAKSVYLKLLELQPDNHQAKFNLSSVMLYFKEFNHAWPLFHSRLQRQDLLKDVQWLSQQWQGESLLNKNIAIWTEQGIGDNLLYSSCFAEAIAQANQTLVICDTRLIALFRHNFPAATFMSIEQLNQKGQLPFTLDLQILAGSLSYLFRQHTQDFKHQQSLSIAPSVLKQCQQQLAPLLSSQKLKVGISWYHGRINDGNRYSMPLEMLLPLFSLPNIEWVNLQFGDYQKELTAVQRQHNIVIHDVKDFSAAGDFDKYGALISQLDLLIAPSNAAFMFGARLGIESWLFTPKPDPLLGEIPEKSIWFDQARQYCKPIDGKWEDVVDRISLMLQAKTLRH